MKALNTRQKVYQVGYYGGDPSEYYDNVLFVTLSKETAKKYVKKYNFLLKKLQEHYSTWEDEKTGWIKPQYRAATEKWYSVKYISKCYYHEIQCR